MTMKKKKGESVRVLCKLKRGGRDRVNDLRGWWKKGRVKFEVP